jgi:curved DNA-binding protein CbpA
LEIFLNVIKNTAENYYETLGIAKTASDEEIKRAYYRMIRTYQPDLFPEEFKKIRAAYEVLSDRKQRTEYDEIGELPASVVPILREAEHEFRFGKDNKAFAAYQKILKSHPDLDVVRERYANTLEMCGKNGKAADVWKELCSRHPGNAVYARKLCACYLHADWHKKAYAEMQRALALDEKSIEAWILFLDCSFGNTKMADRGNLIESGIFEKALQAVEPIKTDEWKKIQMYIRIFMATIPKKYDVAVEYLREVNRLIRENGREGQEEGEAAIKKMLRIIPAEGLGKFYPELKTMAGLLPDSVTELFSDDMDDIKLQYEIEQLVRKGFSDIFHALFSMLTTEFPAKGDDMEIVAIEYALLKERIVYNPQIKRLKAEFPEIYALHQTFFDEALQTGDPDTMRRQRSKQLEKQDRKFDVSEDEVIFDDVPIRRDQPKVGRNDPCPCGSGKKYKKCCGA